MYTTGAELSWCDNYGRCCFYRFKSWLWSCYLVCMSTFSFASIDTKFPIGILLWTFFVVYTPPLGHICKFESIFYCHLCHRHKLNHGTRDTHDKGKVAKEGGGKVRCWFQVPCRQQPSKTSRLVCITVKFARFLTCVHISFMLFATTLLRLHNLEWLIIIPLKL